MRISSYSNFCKIRCIRFSLVQKIVFALHFLSFQSMYAQPNEVNSILLSGANSLKGGNPDESLNILSKIEQGNLTLTAKQWSKWFDLTTKCYIEQREVSRAKSILYQGLNKYISNDTIKADLHFMLGNLLYQSESNYRNAILQMDSSRLISKQLYGKNNILHLRCLNSLGTFNIDYGNYLESKKILEEAEMLNTRKTEEDIIQYARITNNLAEVHAKLQHFAKAEELFKKSLLIKHKTFGRNIDYAKSLYKLANLHFQIGLNDSAKDSILAAIKIFEQSQKTSDPSYPNFLVFLAIMKSKSGQLSQADSLYNTAILAWEKAGIKDNVPYTQSLLGLSSLYNEMGKPQEAVDLLLKKVLPILQLKYNQKDHPVIAAALIVLAKSYYSLSEYKKAEIKLVEAIRMLDKTLGTEHMQVFEAKLEYCKLMRTMKNYSLAKKTLLEIESIPQKQLKRISRYLSDRELGEQVKIFYDYTNEIYNLAFEYPGQSDLAKLAFNTTLFYRGYLLDNMIRVRKKIEKAKEIAELYDQSKELNLQLHKELDYGIENQNNARAIQEKMEQIERKINNALGILSEEADVNWQQISAVLIDTSELVIEYLAFPIQGGQNQMRYSALLLGKGWESPKYIPLTTKDTLLAALGGEFLKKDSYNDNFYLASARGLELTDNSIVNLIWKPLESDLKPVKSITIVPDGVLNRISFYALPASSEPKSILIDQYDISIRYSSRDLLNRINSPVYYYSKDALVVGGINYGKPIKDASQRSGTPSRTWAPLIGASQESNYLKDLLAKNQFKVHSLSEYEVTRTALMDTLNRNREGWRLVHISTHGYYSPDRLIENSTSGYYFSRMKNCALVLSNANLPEHPNWGVSKISASDITQLDLPPTELVVLSACESGLGDFENYEGVLGFSRAFRLAGADKIMVSLWEVSDEDTRIFMGFFYDYWLKEGESQSIAFRRAQSKFRTSRTSYPKLWAAFVLIE
jgi:CHAT domain-containing protein/Tfp pilus assembly protein PilF